MGGTRPRKALTVTALNRRHRRTTDLPPSPSASAANHPRFCGRYARRHVCFVLGDNVIAYPDRIKSSSPQQQSWSILTKYYAKAMSLDAATWSVVPALRNTTDICKSGHHTSDSDCASAICRKTVEECIVEQVAKPIQLGCVHQPTTTKCKRKGQAVFLRPTDLRWSCIGRTHRRIFRSHHYPRDQIREAGSEEEAEDSGHVVLSKYCPILKPWRA